jgi:hypothetical protein
VRTMRSFSVFERWSRACTSEYSCTRSLRVCISSVNRRWISKRTIQIPGIPKTTTNLLFTTLYWP